jgi:hypothetical protein
MEAICKADFDKRVKAFNEAEKLLEQAKKEGKPTSGIIVPSIGYHDIYGVWFFGQLKEIIGQIGTDRFSVDLGKMMHVFTDVEPKNIGDGIQQGQTQHDHLKHLMVLEEAHHLLKKTSTTQSQESSNPQGQAVEFFANALAEMRAYGQGFIIADQSVSALDVAVLRNTNTKIVFRAPFEEDRQAISGALVLDEKQQDALARLESHTAIVKQNNWLEAIQCHIDVSKTRQNLMEPDTKDINTYQADLVRQCRTMLLIALLKDRFPEDVELPSLQCTIEDVNKWIKSLPIDEKTSQYLLLALVQPSTVENFEEIFPALWSIPPLLKTLQSAFQCSVSDRGIINHLVIIIKELTFLTDHAVIAEVIHTLLRAYRTQDSDRVADLLN